MSGLNNPTPATNLKFDSSNNVLSSINSQAINPNTNTLNPYTLTLLSHQTGLSGTPAAANSPVNVGTAITVSRNGIMKITMYGHVSAGNGIIDFTLTRGSTTYYFWILSMGDHTSTVLGSGTNYDSLFVDDNAGYIGSTTTATLQQDIYITSAAYSSLPNLVSMPVLNGDVIQFRVSNSVASDVTYIDDVVVMLQ